jgi:hypothetical protein
MKITVEIPDGDKCNSECPFLLRKRRNINRYALIFIGHLREKVNWNIVRER